ncbi:hypothetical protein BG004_001060 [Podila humilis]|nr:hypothetical protein BG004_001060 [Podila humilis]
MSHNATVLLAGDRKQLVNTTPTMTLRQVVDAVCETQQYPEPESFGLNSLNLTRRTGTRPSTVKNNMIALGRRISRGGRQQRTPVYMLPVVVFLEREYNTIEKLKKTTLELGGLVSGNAVIRVIMRYMDAGIDDFMHRITGTPSYQSNGHSTTPLDEKNNQSNGNSHDEPNTRSMGTRRVSFPPELDTPHMFVPGMTARGGSLDVMNSKRDGNIIAPNGGPSSNGNSDGDTPRQTPAQDMDSAMIEASQEIRQLREQEAQAALTDRVKRLSKPGESSDKDRFSRSLQFVAAVPPTDAAGSSSSAAAPSLSTPTCIGEMNTPFTEEPTADMDIDSGTRLNSTTRTDPQRSASVPSPQEIVRQIAHRVSQQLRDAQSRGEPTLDYQTLIAQEIVKEQKAGILPVTPSGSRHNSVDTAKTLSPDSEKAALPPRPPSNGTRSKNANDIQDSPLTSLSGLESVAASAPTSKDKGKGIKEKGKEKDSGKDRSRLLDRQRSLPMLMRRLSGRGRAEKPAPIPSNDGTEDGLVRSSTSGGSGSHGFPKWMKLKKK